MSDVQILCDAIARAIAPHGYELRKVPLPMCTVAAWCRRTLNQNRGVAVLEIPDGADPAACAVAARGPVAKALGYVPFFWEIGLQLVLVGKSPRWEGDLSRCLDTFSNQRFVLQSVHVVDLDARTRTSARTWGQVLTGRAQDAIAAGIDTALAATGTSRDERAVSTPVPIVATRAAPWWGRALPVILAIVVVLSLVRACL